MHTANFSQKSHHHKCAILFCTHFTLRHDRWTAYTPILSLHVPRSPDKICRMATRSTAKIGEATHSNHEMVHGIEKLQTDSRRTSSDSTFEDHAFLLESQHAEHQPAQPLEYSVSFGKKLTYLALYFLLNLGLTLTNKAVLERVKAPLLLTVMHATATSIGCFALVFTGKLKLSNLGTRERWILVAFSSLFTLNIAVSNVSLYDLPR